MAQFPQSKSQKFLKTALLACASIGLYSAFFANEATVTEYFTKGGYYALLPVLTAFAFSIIHGAFAGQCLEALGISAHKSTIASVSIKKQPAVKKDQRAHLTVN